MSTLVIKDIENSLLFTELTAEESATISGGLLYGIYSDPYLTQVSIDATIATGAAIGATSYLIGDPVAQAGYAGIMNNICSLTACL